MTDHFRSCSGQHGTNRWASQAHGAEVLPQVAGGLAWRFDENNRLRRRVWGTVSRIGKVPTVFLALALLTVPQSQASLQAAGNLENSPHRADLFYHPGTGEVTLIPAPGGKIVGFSLGNAAGQMKPRSRQEFLASTPWDDIVFDNSSKQIGSSDLSFIGTSVEFSLGPIFPPGMPCDILGDFLSEAKYSPGLGLPVLEFDYCLMPEPGSTSLLSLGLLVVSAKWRRKPVRV